MWFHFHTMTSGMFFEIPEAELGVLAAGGVLTNARPVIIFGNGPDFNGADCTTGVWSVFSHSFGEVFLAVVVLRQTSSEPRP